MKFTSNKNGGTRMQQVRKNQTMKEIVTVIDGRRITLTEDSRIRYCPLNAGKPAHGLIKAIIFDVIVFILLVTTVYWGGF